MREATVNEYTQACSRATEREYASGKRYYEVTWKDRGTTVATKHESIRRGKVVSTVYAVNPDYLPETMPPRDTFAPYYEGEAVTESMADVRMARQRREIK